MRKIKTDLPLYILVDKKPVRVKYLHEWAGWYEQSNNRIIEQEPVKDAKGLITGFISTVFTGLADIGCGDLPYFETMVFDYRPGRVTLIVYQHREYDYTSAIEHHRKAVRRWKRLLSGRKK